MKRPVLPSAVWGKYQKNKKIAKKIKRPVLPSTVWGQVVTMSLVVKGSELLLAIHFATCVCEMTPYLICMPHMYALYVCLICMPYMPLRYLCV